MNRILIGALSALLFAGVGMFWLQGRAETRRGDVPPAPEQDTPGPQVLPSANAMGMVGPALPEASALSREQRRFARYDRNSDGRISRNEMLSTRTAAFRKLDKDGNNLLTFEEWAVTTVDKFDHADLDHDRELSPAEFALTKPGKAASHKPKCGC